MSLFNNLKGSSIKISWRKIMNFDNYAHDKDLFNIKQKNNFDGK